MSLCNIQEHLGCRYYVKEEDALFRHYRLDDGGDISDMNNDRSALLYIAEGSLHVVLGHYSPRKIEKGQLLFLPKNIRFCGQSVGLSRFVASFFAGGLPFCNKYDLANLRCQRCRYGTCQNSLPLRKFPQIACCQKIESFFLSLSEYLDDGLNCAHFHKVKQEELCILLRCYYSPEELYTLLKFVIGNDDRFRDFVLRYYKDVNDVSAFAALAHMSVCVISNADSKRSSSDRFWNGLTNAVLKVSCAKSAIPTPIFLKLDGIMALQLNLISRPFVSTILERHLWNSAARSRYL